jgi:hypothetical protein
LIWDFQADVRKGPLDLVDVLLGSSVQRRERSLADGVDFVSEGAGRFRVCQRGRAASADCIWPKLSFIKGLAFHELGGQVGDALREFEGFELQGGLLILEHPDACLNLFVAETGGPLRFASRRLSPKARFAVVFAGCIGVADVARGEDNFQLLCSPIGSAEELGGSSASGLAIIMASVVAGRDFLEAGVLVRLEADLAIFLRRLVVVDDGLRFFSGMNIPIGDAWVLPLPSPVREIS